jgi:hypothetical protein
MFKRDDRFFDVPRTARLTTIGRVELPILYYEASNVVALFRASRAGAERLLDRTGLVPQVDRRGDAIVALSFYDYRRTSIGPYREVGTALLALPRGVRQPRLGVAEMLTPARWRTSGAYVVDLPVTTPAACAAGREIWGYPKFVTDISYETGRRDFAGVVFEPVAGPAVDRAGARRIVTLRGGLGPGLAAPPLGVVTYSVLGDRSIRTTVTVRGRVHLRPAASLRLEVGPSGHPMAENLRTLGLSEGQDGSRPGIVFETDRFQSILPAGVSAPMAPEPAARAWA